jgi:heme oxygenase
MLETKEKNKYESFQSEKNYAFAHWLHQSENSKRNVDNFFQNSRLSKFHEELSFKNDDRWLNQLSKIKIDIQKNTWLEQDLIVVSKIVDEFNDIVTI